MSKIKEILAPAANKMAHKAKDNWFEEYKERLMEKIINAANNGEFDLKINTLSCRGNWGKVKDWLEGLGFRVEWRVEDIFPTIKWDDVSIAEIEMVTEPKPATVTYAEKLSKIEFGWNYDTTRYDFVCSCCNEHSEYTSNYCPHCGAKMYVPNGGKRRDY